MTVDLESRDFTNAPELVAAIAELCDMAGSLGYPLDTIYIVLSRHPSYNPNKAVLVEETLSDDSKVYNIELRG